MLSHEGGYHSLGGHQSQGNQHSRDGHKYRGGQHSLGGHQYQSQHHDNYHFGKLYNFFMLKQICTSK